MHCVVQGHSFSTPFAVVVNDESENREPPATCEVHSMIQFLDAKNVCPVEVHRQVVEVYDEGAGN